MTVKATGSRSLAADVAQRLAARASGVEPRTKLGTKVELQRETGVAAATLNEALRMLEVQGIVTLKSGPSGGVFTAAPNPLVRMGQAIVEVSRDASSVREAVAVRQCLDPLTVIEAARHRTASQVEEMRRRLEVAEGASDDLSFARAIWDFHRAIYEAGGNEILRSVALGLIDYIAGNVTGVVPKSPEQRWARVESHRALVDAIESQDVQRCRLASGDHDETETLGELQFA